MGADKITIKANTLDSRASSLLYECKRRSFINGRSEITEIEELGIEFKNAKNEEERKDAVESFIVKSRGPYQLRRIRGMGFKTIDKIVDWLGEKRIKRINGS